MNADLFDAIIERQHLKNDAALARFLDTKAPVISKQRAEILSVGPCHMIGIHEETGMEIKEIKALISKGRAEPLGVGA